MSDLLAAALAEKLGLPMINALLDDAMLKRAFDRYQRPDDWEENGEPLNAVTALGVVPPVAAVLERHLAVLDAAGAVSEDARRQLRANLVNRREGFLHTMSELALARHLVDEGWRVALAAPLPGGGDADIFAERDGHNRHIEVVNYEARPLPPSTSAFIRLPTSDEIIERMASKVAGKVLKKFRDPWTAGWRGSVWVAVDYGKHDELKIACSFLQRPTRMGWEEATAARLARDLPELAGVLFYDYSASNDTLTAATWTPTKHG